MIIDLDTVIGADGLRGDPDTARTDASLYNHPIGSGGGEGGGATGPAGPAGPAGPPGADGTGGGGAIINTDGDPGTALFVGTIDPSVENAPVAGDAWIAATDTPAVKKWTDDAWVDVIVAGTGGGGPSVVGLVTVVGDELIAGAAGTLSLDLSAAEVGDVILLGYGNYTGVPAGFAAFPGPFNYGLNFAFRYKIASGSEGVVTTASIGSGSSASAVAAIFRGVVLDTDVIAGFTHAEGPTAAGSAAPTPRPTDGLDVMVGVRASGNPGGASLGFNAATGGWTLETEILGWAVATQPISGSAPAPAGAGLYAVAEWMGMMRVTFPYS